MRGRIVILAVIIFAALGGLSWLGYRAIGILAEGMESRRWGEFAAVAEQIRRDVKRKLDEFIELEQKRPYTDYQYYYVPEGVVGLQQQIALARSPLGDKLEQGLAYGHFQIGPDGGITTPYYQNQQAEEPREDMLQSKGREHLEYVLDNVASRLNTTADDTFASATETQLAAGWERAEIKDRDEFRYENSKTEAEKVESQAGAAKKGAKSARSATRRGKSLPIKSLQKEQSAQFLNQSRATMERNVASNRAVQQLAGADARAQVADEQQFVLAEVEEVDEARLPVVTLDDGEAYGVYSETVGGKQNAREQLRRPRGAEVQRELGDRATGPSQMASSSPRLEAQADADDVVEIRIEPLVPMLIEDPAGENGMFGGKVFMVRHVQIEERHLLQGFRLDEERLLEEIRESAQRLVLAWEGMCFELSQEESDEAAYTASLDFGFGDLVLNLAEMDPGWIGKETGKLRDWYFSIIAVVLVAVSLGLVGLWRNLRAQVKLTQKKDDFISAVSHELRTPLTSIRMYTEMLEKNWVKSDEKRGEYYQNMRQESERLSRLIENVLDFSRIQRGRKKFSFQLGDVNKCVERVVEMMTPYAQQAGFVIEREFEDIGEIAFDSDAVMQIVINLVDNAIKYAGGGQEKRITVRTKRGGKYVLIEVEDRGPGLAHSERRKVFDEFYRCEDESRRETTGVGLGLALVKKFAVAHNGFVEILGAKPSGAILRVALAAQV